MKFTKPQIITMISLIGVGLFNPMSVEILEEYFKMFYTGISLLCGVWLCVFMLYKAFKPEPVKLPKKSAKTQKAGKYIET